MTTIPPGPVSRHVRPAVRWFAIVAVILLLPFAAHAVWDFVETRRLVRELEAIRARREGLTAGDVGRGYRQLNDEETRAARYYMAAAVLADPIGSKDRSAQRDLAAILTGAASGAELSRIHTRIAAIAGEGSELLALVDKASGLPFNGFPAGTEYNYRTSEMWALRDVNAIRTAWLSLEGRGDAAANSAIADLRLRSLGGVPGFWFYANDVATVLSFSRPSPEALTRMDAALAAGELPERATADLMADRALLIDSVWREYYGPDPRVPSARTLGRRSLDGWLGRPWISHSLVSTLQAWQETIEASKTPWPGKLQAARDVAARQPAPVIRAQAPWPVRIRRPIGLEAPGRVIASASVLAADRGARVAIAIERYRRDHADVLPTRLDELVPAYMKALPEDPLSGKPLLFKPSPDAYTIYSVGEDGKDDGGDLISEFVRDTQRGWGRRPLRGKDMGIRVLLAQTRTP